MINYNGAKLSNEKGLRAQAKKGRERHQRGRNQMESKRGGVKRKRGEVFTYPSAPYISAVQTLIKFYHTRETMFAKKANL